MLRKRGVVELYALAEPNHALSGFDSVLPVMERSCLPFPTRYFDAIVLLLDAAGIEPVREWFSALAPFLALNGYMVFEAANASYWRGAEGGVDIEPVRVAMEMAGLQLYGIYRTISEDDPEIERDGEYVTVEGRRMYAPDELAYQTLMTPMYRFVGIRPEYNPLDHACVRFDASHPDEAYEILAQIPKPCFDNPDASATIHSTIVLCQLALDRGAADTTERLKRFMIAQWSFYCAIARAPRLHNIYRAQAEFWHRLGHTDMAARLLRSIQHVEPDEGVSAQLAGYGQPSRLVPPDDTAPPWEPPSSPPRVLFVMHPRPHYGLDIVYDGLCTVLGVENVVEYPWKPSLHGRPPESMANYPCVFDRPGTRLTSDELLCALNDGAFDAVLFGDVEHAVRRPMARRLMESACRTPVFLFDAQDTCDDTRAEMAEFLGIESFAGVFKREMLIGVDYGPNAFPLPFAYPDERVPLNVEYDRPYDLFWAGHREFGLRRLYLERLEVLTKQSFSLAFSQEDYVKVMKASRVGLNIFGMGFDTVRYWELPAHGCMLFAERLPIRVPFEFRDGENALFFDDMRELERRLAYCIAHRDETAAIAQAGREHFLQHHTGSARAKQALAWMRQCGAFDRRYMRNA